MDTDIFMPQSRELTIAALDNLYESTKKRRLDDEAISYPRSFRELKEKASQLAATSQPASGIYGDDHMKLLSQYSFDAQKLRNQIASFEPERSVEGPNISDVTDIDGFITRQTDAMIWNQILESTGRTPVNSLQEAIRAREEDWNSRELEKGQSEFMESLGHSCSGGVWPGSKDGIQASNGSNLAPNTGDLNKNVGADGRTFFYGKERTEFSRGHAEIVKKIALSQSYRQFGKPSRRIVSSYNTTDEGNKLLNNGNIGDNRGQTENHGQASEGMFPGAVLPFGADAEESDLLRADRYNTQAIKRPATAFVELINSTIAKGGLSPEDRMSQKDLEGYHDLMMMIAATVQENSQGPAPPGAFSTVCFEAMTNRNRSGVNDSVQVASAKAHAHVSCRLRLTLTMGCKRHLETQIREMWSEFVDSAVRDGQMRVHTAAEGQSSRQRIRSYVCVHDQMGLLRERGARIRNPRDNETPLWPFVYHCLRAGDLEGAEQELSTCAAAGLQVETAILVVLRLFRGILGQLSRSRSANGAGLAGTTGEINDYRSVGAEADIEPSALLSSLEKADLDKALFTCRDLYEQEEGKPEDMRNAYRLFVLNLVSLSDVDNLQHPSSEIEHYLWGNLWFIHWEGVLSQCGYDNISPDSYDNGESVLFEKFLAEGGERYFEEGEDPNHPDFEPFSPFVYSKVLLCCQRYGDAVEYLWRKQRTFAAVHLMTVCLHYGLILPHRRLTDNPPCHSVRKGSLAIVGGEASQMYRVPTPANILRVYVGIPLSLDYPEAATDYLMCLDSCWELGLQATRHNINPDETFWESERVEAETALAQELTQLLVSLHKPQIERLCGTVRYNSSTGAKAGHSSSSSNAMLNSSGLLRDRSRARLGTNDMNSPWRGDGALRGRNEDRMIVRGSQSRTDGDRDSSRMARKSLRNQTGLRTFGTDESPHLEYFSARSRGYLDTHFDDPGQVDYLLCRAAYFLLTELHNAESGILLYQLAGRYADAITEIINQLTQVATASASNNHRIFWSTMGTSFFEQHLKSGDRPVVLLLEQEDQLGLVKTLEITLELCKFFDLAAQKDRLGDALCIADTLDLVPVTTEDVPRMTDKAKELNPFLLKLLDALLVKTMESTHQLYKRQKAEKEPLPPQMIGSGNEEHMRTRAATAAAQVRNGRDAVFSTLKERAKALVRFACDITSLLQPHTPSLLSQYEMDM